MSYLSIHIRYSLFAISCCNIRRNTSKWAGWCEKYGLHTSSVRRSQESCQTADHLPEDGRYLFWVGINIELVLLASLTGGFSSKKQFGLVSDEHSRLALCRLFDNIVQDMITRHDTQCFSLRLDPEVGRMNSQPVGKHPFKITIDNGLVDLSALETATTWETTWYSKYDAAQDREHSNMIQTNTNINRCMVYAVDIYIYICIYNI